MRLLLAASALALAGMAPPPQASIQGLWRTDDGKGIVRIAPCGSHMCGTIARVLSSGPNVPTRDVNNPDPKLRGRPILGLPILTGFQRSGAAWKDGKAYDPKTGRSYRSSLALEADGRLRVTGCVLFVCQSKRWTRASAR